MYAYILLVYYWMLQTAIKTCALIGGLVIERAILAHAIVSRPHCFSFSQGQIRKAPQKRAYIFSKSWHSVVINYVVSNSQFNVNYVSGHSLQILLDQRLLLCIYLYYEYQSFDAKTGKGFRGNPCKYACITRCRSLQNTAWLGNMCLCAPATHR